MNLMANLNDVLASLQFPAVYTVEQSLVHCGCHFTTASVHLPDR
jgi:hypothetical protein